jgi:predicted nucleotidyltransferase component of viral defense system
VSPDQRDILLGLLKNRILDSTFFLTGGTALSVFYLHHRTSNDLDFFTLETIDISKIDFLLKSVWSEEYIKIKESSTFLSLLLKNIKVDFVIDRLSSDEKRDEYALEENCYLKLDTIKNIFANKLTTLVSRNEPKDYIDFYFCYQQMRIHTIDDVYQLALTKDAIFEDNPTVAYQIEEGINFLRNASELIPKLLIKIDWDNFFDFYKKLIADIYHK